MGLTRQRRARDDRWEAVREAVGAVADPELDVSLAVLDMVGDVTTGRDGSLTVELRLTTQACPLREVLHSRVLEAVSSLVPGRAVTVEFSVMTEAARRNAAAAAMAAQGPGVSGVGHVVAVASGKGGVGKSSVAANLAVALAREGKRVGLIDADVWGYSVPQLFGVSAPPIAMYGAMLPVLAHGVRLMSLGFLVEEDTPIVWRGPMLQKALAQFVHEVRWGDLDVLLVDLPPGTGDVTISVLELLPEASLLLVTTPQEAARRVAGRVGRMAVEASAPLSGVVENMSGVVCRDCGHGNPVFGSGGGARLAADLGAPFLGAVPLDVELCQAGDVGVPVVIGSPESSSARALVDVAEKLRPVRRSLVGRALPLTPV